MAKKAFLDLAESTWIPTEIEKIALSRRNHFRDVLRVDQIWFWLSENYGDTTAVVAPHSNPPEEFTYRELSSKISKLSGVLKSYGVVQGDIAALFSENSPRWLIADQAIMRVGAANAVRGATAPIEELRYILNDSSAKVLFVQSQELWRSLDLPDDNIKDFKLIVQLEGESSDKRIISWESLFNRNISETIDDLSESDTNYIDSNLASILYTSGTTGKPKGVPLTHENFLHQINSLACVAHPSPGSSVLSVLPIWHSYERSAEYFFFSCGCTQTYTTIKNLKNDLAIVKPVVMATVPRLWESIQVAFDDALNRMPLFQKIVLQLALSNSKSYKLAARAAKGLLIEEKSFGYRMLAKSELIVRWPLHFIASTFLWPKVRSQVSGGKLNFPINGGGAIAPYVDLFFEAIGIDLLVGYGLTETSPVVSCRRPWNNIRGSSGTPLPSTEFKIVDSKTMAQKSFRQIGLVLVRGPQVMKGYLNRPESTAEVLDSEGWFNTGDLGMLLTDGSLILTGRQKDTIVLSSGENIEPSPLEEALLASPLVNQIMLIGQDRKQLGALLVPQEQALMEWARDKSLCLSENLGGSPGDATLRSILKSEFNQILSLRKGSRINERIIGVALVDPFSIENGLLTQTLKQRRDKILIRDRTAVDSIYGS